MTRHTSSRHDKKNSVTELLSADQETTSGYQALSYWMMGMVGLLSLGLLLQRFRGAMPASPVSPSFTTVTLPHDNIQPSYEIQFPGLTPLLLSSAVTHQTGNSVVGVLSSLPLWFARPVAAQTGVNIVVPEFRVNSAAAGDQGGPSVATLSTGDWVVVWQSGRITNQDIYAQRYAMNGSVLGTEFRVNTATSGDQYSPSVASLSTGEWVVVWVGDQTGDNDIYAQRYGLSGSVLGTEFRVNTVTTGDQYTPAVASLSTGEWVVAWQGRQTGDPDIYARRYAANGSVLGSEFRVNSATTGNQYYPKIASLSTGEWVVVWYGEQTGNADIYARRYAANGSVLGTEFRVNSKVMGDQFNVAVASRSTGEWVVVWVGSQTGDYEIYAQRYAANGSVLGSEFRVNSATTSSPSNPEVVSTSTGEWVVVWQSFQTDDDIYAQRYASNGSVLGSEFRVNSATTSDQYDPKVASLSTGEWVAVWAGSQTGNGDIYGSIFSSTGLLTTTASPTPSGITTSTLTTTMKSTVTSQLSSTSSPPLTTTTDNLATLSTLTTRQASSTLSSTVATQVSSTLPLPLTTTTGNSATTSLASPTFPSAVTTQISGTSPTSLSTTTNDHSVKTPAITTSLSASTSSSSAGVSGTLTTATNHPPNNPTTPQLVTATNANSVVSGAVIGAAVGGSVLGLAVCLGALGFYAYRKKLRAGQANHSAVNESVGTSLKTIEQTTAQSASEYAQVNLKEANQSDNFIPVSHSPYGRIDEMKKQEKEYDHAPSF